MHHEVMRALKLRHDAQHREQEPQVGCHRRLEQYLPVGQALDPIATLAIEDLIRELKQNYTIVIVTHNMQQATRVSDRTAFFSVLRNEKPGGNDTRTGVLVEYGSTQQIFEDPHDSRTQAYVTGRVG